LQFGSHIKAEFVDYPEQYRYSSAVDYAGGNGLLKIELIRGCTTKFPFLEKIASIALPKAIYIVSIEKEI
jgi:hypothetical protein